MQYLTGKPFSVAIGQGKMTAFDYAVAVGSIPAGIFRVVVDKGVLAGFKARALHSYPIEHCECLWGKVENGTAYVSVIERVQVDEADETGVDIETGDFGEELAGMSLMGTIHTHPDDTCEPSETDIEESIKAKEWFFGICAINKVNNRRYVSFAFFLPNGKTIELAISEPDKRRCPTT
ncbi:MAG: hypothetical protein C5B44_05740 [Acidobacteria bacterium]|nr:MAG: hypothetical protein C5B44_05740 [Acidobacteriota bacterium]